MANAKYLSEEKRSFIEDLAYLVLDEYEIEPPIGNVYDMVKKLGGEIEEGTYTDEGVFDAAVKKTGENSFCIFLSPYIQGQRRNLVIAEELGHLFLHMGYIIAPERWAKQRIGKYRLYNDSEKKKEAHQFAVALMMPKGAFARIVRENDEDGKIALHKLTSSFGIPHKEILARGIELGILE